ncbi:DNA polymerase-4 [Bifidobacterium bohemicum]|uniref:DNA polymerase IV n=1 Tax=Bifidobacterium bohemicum DSM 22767 TaxID=1437606 RepID=A0A086ZE95_9BIFI|nr:DNA polymerase IV [Bifidobacterium bohemicum DSM 22767]SCB95376.1 DNA polymerase-4 [Bifidobacterium bohemicum]
MSTAPRLEAAKRDWGDDETNCTVLHIDMDAFYASLETARHPELRGRPVIIGWLGSRSVVSAANYEARKYGVNSAMPMARAKQLCPGGAFVPVDMTYYRTMSKRIFTEVFQQVTDQIEQVSVDEGYMDVSGALLLWKSPRAIGAWVRQQVARRYGITCSVGVASNKLVAKLASTNAKPDGMLMIPEARQAQFVQMMPLRAIPGIGPSLGKRLDAWGIKTVADLAQMDETALFQATRSHITAHHLFLASRGLDPRPVEPHAPEKSIGAEVTFEQDTRDMTQVRELLHHCCNEVSSTLRAKSLVARTVTVKLRFADLSYSTKSHTLEQPMDTTTVMYPESVSLLRSMLKIPANASDSTPLPREIRLAGVSASSLSDRAATPVQLSFDDMFTGGDGVDKHKSGNSRRGQPDGHPGNRSDARQQSGNHTDSTGAGTRHDDHADTGAGTNTGSQSGNHPSKRISDSQRKSVFSTPIGQSERQPQRQKRDSAPDVSQPDAARSPQDALRKAESALDAVHGKFGKHAAGLGIEHDQWKARQVAGNSHLDPRR